MPFLPRFAALLMMRCWSSLLTSSCNSLSAATKLLPLSEKTSSGFYDDSPFDKRHLRMNRYPGQMPFPSVLLW